MASGTTVRMLAAASFVLTAWTGPTAFARLTPKDFSTELHEAGSTLWTDIESENPISEVIPSWNVRGGGALRVEIKGLSASGETKGYSLGSWSLDPALRASQKDQNDENGKVYTDTLVFTTPVRKLRVILHLTRGSSGASPELKRFYLSLTGPQWTAKLEEPFKAVWGTEYAVRPKAQHDYPGGNVLCSPTSMSMLLNFLGDADQRPELCKDVPEIQANVFDPVYDGAGNWPFNTAYAGSFEGVEAFVTRLHSLRQAEEFINAGVPIACSVDYKKLLDKEWEGDSGHLVVLVGFTAEGDPVINDPAKRKEVRQVYPRDRFISAWASSKNAVYIVSREGLSFPAASGPWPH